MLKKIFKTITFIVIYEIIKYMIESTIIILQANDDIDEYEYDYDYNDTLL